MASYAELLQTCAEFQENFSALTGKYNALSLELKNTKAVCERKQRQLDEAAAREEQQRKELLELKKEVDDAAGFRQRYHAAAVATEHLKSQLACAHQSAIDASLEHDQEVQQLKQQLEDMIKRVETATDGQRLREAQRQTLELEERCATMHAQLLEDRERHSQQLLTAHNALREQQSRNLELEQRCRAMEADVAEMRAAVRRSTELQNEAALLKERYSTAATVAQHQVEELRAEAEEARRRLAQLKADHEAQLAQVTQDAAEAREELHERVASLTADLATAQSNLAEERSLCRKMQASAEEQVMQARNASVVEASALRRAQAALKEENTRLQWRLEKMDGELREGQQALQALQSRHDSLAAKLQQSQSQLDTAAQQEAWLTCERQNIADQLAVARQQLDALSKALMNHEEVALQAQQLTIRLASATEEAQSHRRAALMCESQLRDVEEASALKVRELRRELKTYKKQCTNEAARADRLRRKLMAALVEKEAELYRVSRATGRALTLEGEPAIIPTSGTVLHDSAYSDVIGMLRNQSQQAEELHTRLVQLAR
ncbi:hypothetical protein, conserved [Leishmania donovani]|uniref:Uncharacterized protein n=1 Tax=Leishmania donovani TaxID=5661 RepID=A0A3Q8IHG3_LEIDO|nr:hypothetical protein, conserved [Leishmania donovani]AYU83690.1 hypothetical protein LdCL_360040500 [Leishmania donovani]TPP48444.1 hypothetical protein CGC21_13970 [Leishmania donovani]CBZ38775.1 hypothetical protein, conserved [Leishmania donovani]